MVAQIDTLFIKLSKKKTYTRLISYLFFEGRPLTTKGRWFNPVVFFLYYCQTILPFNKKVVKPIFILGTGRSGTTILGVTLGLHKDVGFLNEPKALWSFLYYQEDLIGSYNSNNASYRIGRDVVTDKIRKNAHRIFGNYLRFSLSSRVVDKYPELIFRSDFVTEIFPDARFLFLYRDGYDTCHSIRHWSERLGQIKKDETHDWWGKNDRKWHLMCDQIVANDDMLGSAINEIRQYTDHTLRAAVEWIVTMKEGLRLMADKPDCVIGIRYEDYVAKPEIRQQVLKFCDLSPDSNYQEYSRAVLTAPSIKPRIEFPSPVNDEFIRVMKLLGYE